VSLYTEIDHTCPKCGQHLNKASSAYGEEEAPCPGDISVCINCGSVGTYVEGEKLNIRRLTKEEFDEVWAESYQLREVLLAWRTMYPERAL
jgi:hypothetical protein